MKSIFELQGDAQKALHVKYGAFVAISDAQYAEGMKKHAYPATTAMANLGGVFLPSKHVAKYVEASQSVFKDAIARHKTMYSAEQIIVAELMNYECQFADRVDEVKGALKSYEFTPEQYQQAIIAFNRKCQAENLY